MSKRSAQNLSLTLQRKTTPTPSSRLRKLRGKVVDKVLVNRSWNDEQKNWAYNPTIVFKDGTSIVFYNDSDEFAGVDFWIKTIGENHEQA